MALSAARFSVLASDFRPLLVVVAVVVVLPRLKVSVCHDTHDTHAERERERR
jgi:hypothetical protein